MRSKYWTLLERDDSDFPESESSEEEGYDIYSYSGPNFKPDDSKLDS